MCYPFGGYDDRTLALLKKQSCALGLTTKVGILQDLGKPLELLRLDTNDLPSHGDARPCRWTLQVS